MKKACLVLLLPVLLIPVLSFGKSAQDEDTFKFYDDVQYNSVKITSVALLPFKNNVGKQTSEEVGNIYESVKGILESKGIKVVDATPELEKQKVDVAFDEITADKLAAIGKALGTDAVLAGTIYKFQTSKKGIATVGITGDMLLTSSGSYIYRAKLAREKKINATKKWLTGVFRGESKGNRMKALNDCVSDFLNPLYEKLGESTAFVEQDTPVKVDAKEVAGESSSVEAPDGVSENQQKEDVADKPSESQHTTTTPDKPKFEMIVTRVENGVVTFNSCIAAGIKPGITLKANKVVESKAGKKEYPYADLEVLNVAEGFCAAKLVKIKPNVSIAVGDTLIPVEIKK